jgi:hypothetical protein
MKQHNAAVIAIVENAYFPVVSNRKIYNSRIHFQHIFVKPILGKFFPRHFFAAFRFFLTAFCIGFCFALPALDLQDGQSVFLSLSASTSQNARQDAHRLLTSMPHLVSYLCNLTITPRNNRPRRIHAYLTFLPIDNRLVTPIFQLVNRCLFIVV